MKGFLSGRVSIWSISQNWGVIYYILFSAQTTLALCLISWREIFVRDRDTPTETLIAIGQASAPLILTIAAETLVIILAMEGIAMLAERYLQKRYEAGEEAERMRNAGERKKIEEERMRNAAERRGLEEERTRLEEERKRLEEQRIRAVDEERIRAEERRIRAADEERIRAEERHRIHNVMLDAWDERRLRAQAEGKPFDEPMPRYDDYSYA